MSHSAPVEGDVDIYMCVCVYIYALMNLSFFVLMHENWGFSDAL